MSQARAFVIPVVLAVFLSMPVATAEKARDGTLPGDGSDEHQLERIVYDLFGLGGGIGDTRCVRVSLMQQSAPMTVAPHAGANTVGVEAGGAELLGYTVVVMAFPFECASGAGGTADPEEQSLQRVLP